MDELIKHLNETKPSGVTHGVAAVYKITNLLDGKIYIGATSNYYNRYRVHTSSNRNRTTAIALAIEESGLDRFKFQIIEILEKDSGVIAEREQYWIDKLRSCDREFGYNTQKKVNPINVRNLVKINSYFTDKQVDGIKQISVETGRMVSELLREAVDLFLLDQALKREKRKGE